MEILNLLFVASNWRLLLNFLKLLEWPWNHELGLIQNPLVKLERSCNQSFLTCSRSFDLYMSFSLKAEGELWELSLWTRNSLRIPVVLRTCAHYLSSVTFLNFFFVVLEKQIYCFFRVTKWKGVLAVGNKIMLMGWWEIMLKWEALSKLLLPKNHPNLSSFPAVWLQNLFFIVCPFHCTKPNNWERMVLAELLLHKCRDLGWSLWIIPWRIWLHFLAVLELTGMWAGNCVLCPRHVLLDLPCPSTALSTLKWKYLG